MTDVFDEVEENLRADKLNNLWKRIWPLLLGASIAIVAMVGANSYFADAKAKKIEERGLAFEKGLKALEIQDADAARAAFGEDMAEESGFAELAAHYLAQAEIQSTGDAAAAAEPLQDAAKGEGPLADLARLKAAYFLADSSSLAEVETQLGALLNNDGSFGALAQELVAAKALEEGDFARARSEYQALTLRLNVPQGVAERATEALTVIPKTVSDGADVAEGDASEEAITSDENESEEIVSDVEDPA